MPSTEPSAVPNQPTLILVDGHSLAFRSYYAFARGRDGGLRTSTGIPTSVCYGFLKSLLDMMEAEKPEYVAVAFDLAQPTFRHEADETYKEGRPETPEDFLEDIENLQALLKAFQLPIFTAPGYEADDVLGTVAKQASQQGYRVKILSGDQDLFQLIDPDHGITILHLGSTFAQRGSGPQAREFGPEEVQQKLGILPSQVVDYKALCGDTSDNIPGVKGIGAKTAVKLLTTYGSLEDIYAALDQIKGANKNKLETGKASALHSQFMARIVVDVPLEVDLADCKLAGFDPAVVEPALKKLEFQHFINRIKQLQQVFSGEAIALSPDAEPDESEDISFFTAAETQQAQQQLVTVAITPQVIDTPDLLATLVARLKTHQDPMQPVTWDTETTALDPRDAELVGIGCCWGPDLADLAYIPVGHQQGQNLDRERVLNSLRPILESSDYPKALQNAKFDRLILRGQGIELAGVVFDTMLASYVLNPEARHNLADLSLRYLGIT
ncbi:MAG: DNA polymerase I, partial [Cyanothece sp. SIO1E1]|nr:DNA polymerase I [Cyanothece sp. SIO1E1]